MSEGLRTFNSTELPIGQRFVTTSPDGKYVRTLIYTGFIAPNQNLPLLTERFIPRLDHFEGTDKMVCIGSKVISLLQGRYKRVNQIIPGSFARFATRFGTRTIHGNGVAGHPEKLQAAIDDVGLARIVLAAGVSALEKVALHYGIINKRKGLFFLIAGKRVESIDGLIADGGYQNHVILCPNNYNKVSTQLERVTGLPNAVIDINDLGGSVLSISEGSPYTKQEIFSALSDNPFGQDKRRLPLAVIGKV